MKFRKFRKNAKGLSPVIATIILIAVTVAVSVVVAAWMGALTIGFMGNSEQASISGVTLSNGANLGDGTVVCNIQNTGSSTLTIKSASIDGISGAGVTYTLDANNAPIVKGSAGTCTFTVTGVTDGGAAAAPFVNTAQYTIRLQTAKGNTLVSQVSYTGP